MEKSNSTHEDLIEGLPYDEVHRRAIEARTSFGKAQRALSFWLLEMERRKLYSHFGCSSVFHYAELYLELAPHTIAEHLRAGKEMERLPLLAGAFSGGKISSSKIREISRVATPDTEEKWLQIAASSTCRQVERLVAITPKGDIPGQAVLSTSHASQKKINDFSEAVIKSTHNAGEGSSACPDCSIDEGQFAPANIFSFSACNEKDAAQYRRKLILDLENEQTEIFSAAILKARKETGFRGKSDLLIHIMKNYLDSSTKEKHKNNTPYRITLHHIPQKNLTWVVGADGSRNFVKENVLSMALCDAEILDLGEENEKISDPTGDHKISETYVNGDSGKKAEEPVTETQAKQEIEFPEKSQIESAEEYQKTNTPEKYSYSFGPRLRKTVTTTLKRQVFERDMNQCTVPGCPNKMFLHVHHINHVNRGGKNRKENLTILCSRHHREVHDGVLSITGIAPNELVWKNKSGEILKGSSFAMS